jgi:hypothetical protein
LFLEYEDVLKRPEQRVVHGLSPAAIDEFLAELAALAEPVDIHSPGRCTRKAETMSRATYPLKLPISIKKAAQRLAKEDGVSLNQWIAVAVAEKVGVVETAAGSFESGPARRLARG